MKYHLTLTRKVNLGNYENFELSVTREFDSEHVLMEAAQKQLTADLEAWMKSLANSPVGRS